MKQYLDVPSHSGLYCGTAVGDQSCHFATQGKEDTESEIVRKSSQQQAVGQECYRFGFGGPVHQSGESECDSLALVSYKGCTNKLSSARLLILPSFPLPTPPSLAHTAVHTLLRFEREQT